MFKLSAGILALVMVLMSSTTFAIGAFEYSYVELRLGEGTMTSEVEVDYDIQSFEVSIQPDGRGSAMFSLGYSELDDIAVPNPAFAGSTPDIDQETYFITLGNEVWGNTWGSITARLGVAMSTLRSDIDSVDGTDGKEVSLLINSRWWLTNYIELGVNAHYSYLEVGKESESGPTAGIALAYHLTHAIRLGAAFERSEIYDDLDIETTSINVRLMF